MAAANVSDLILNTMDRLCYSNMLHIGTQNLAPKLTAQVAGLGPLSN